MTFETKYVKLCEIEILHLYFLNKGTENYDSMNSEEQTKQLDTYNFEHFIRVYPTIQTQRMMSGYNMLFNTHNSGCSVWVKVDANDDAVPFVKPDDDFVLTFLLKLSNYRFQNYTNLKFESLSERYYFSNKRLESEPPSFPLINKLGDHNKIDETFLLSDDGVKLALSELVSGEKSNLFGVIRIHLKGENNSMDILNNQGEIPSPYQKFELLFENRKTWWRYIFQTDQSISGGDDVEQENGDPRILISKTDLPLTQKGFVQVELKGVELPNASINSIKPEDSGNKIFSEIYM